MVQTISRPLSSSAPPRQPQRPTEQPLGDVFNQLGAALLAPPRLMGGATGEPTPVKTVAISPGSMPNGPIGTTPGHFANVRFNNPGAMYPGAAATEFGSTGTGVIGGGHKIAYFPTPVHGAAANMQNLASAGYVGLPISQAISRWSGGSRAAVPGFDPSTVITPEMMRDPRFVVPFVRAIASGEAPGQYPMSDAQWQQAFNWYKAGKPGM